MKLISKSPSKNYEVLGEVEETTKDEVLEKLQKAREIQKYWEDLGLIKRIEILREIYNGFEAKFDEIARLISAEMGKPIIQAEAEMTQTLSYFKWDLDNAGEYISPEVTFENDTEIHKVFYEAKGIVATITPFNYPFSLFVGHTYQNLIVGNVVINKPDPSTPLLCKLLEEIINNTTLPKGVQQIVYGGKEIGIFLVEQDINMICFVGNTKTGEYLHKVAATKMIPILMELGGSAAGIVCEDSDLDSVIDGIFKKKFTNAGQFCHGLKRLIVHENIFDDVVERLKNICEKQIIGDSDNRNATLGSLVSKNQLNTLIDQFNDAVIKGAKVICGGKQPTNLKGSYFEPTILTNITKDMKVWKEEVFGPVLPVVSFKTIDEAIELGNDTIYGLGGYVFTTNKETFEKVSKELKTGMVSCNNLAYSLPKNPFGGTKASGLGRVRGKWGFRELCNIKVVAFEK